MKNSEVKQRKIDQNRDSWYGMVHIKDYAYLHQRSAKHYYKGADEDIFVPTTMMDGEDDAHLSTGRRVLKKAIKIALFIVVAVFIAGMLIYIITGNPSLGDIRPSDTYKMF